MKKPLFFVLLSAVSPAIWVPAQAQDTAPLPVQNVAPLSTNAAPFRWKLNLKAGQKWVTTTDTSTESVQTMPAMPAKPAAQGAKTEAPAEMLTLTKTHMVTEQNVLSSDETGARVEMTYREMSQQTRTTQGEKVVFDSANPPAGMEGLAAMTKGFVGAKISFLLSPSGQISDVLGAEEYVERMLKGMEEGLKNTPNAAGTLSMLRAMMKSTMSSEAIKNSFGQTYNAMPKTPIPLGESWKTSVVLPVMGTSFTQNNENTFASRQGGLVTLGQKGEFSTDAGAEFKIPLPAPRDPKTPAPITQMDMRGALSGETVIDEATGMMMSSRMTQTMAGEMVMSGLTGKGSILTIPMRMKTEIVATTREIQPEIEAEIKVTP